MAKNKTLELSIKIAGRVDKSLAAALNTSQNQISDFSRSISRAGTAGLAAMGALSVGTIAAIDRCTKVAEEYENYMADVVKVTAGLTDEAGNAITENVAAMEESLKDLSTQIPYTFQELTKLAEAAGQSGKSFEQLTTTPFLKDIAMWGTAMDISSEQAGAWGAKWEQAFRMTHDEVMDVADVVNYLGNNYATSAAEIAEVTNKSAAMGQLVDVDVEETAAIGAAMLAMGGEADHVATAVNRIYTNISKGNAASAKQKVAWEKLGFTAEGIAKAMQVDGRETLLSVFEAINRMPEFEKLSTLNTLFGQWAVQDSAKITQNLDLLLKMMDEVNDPSVWEGSMEKEFLIKATTPEAVDMMLQSSKAALADDIGSAFVPAKKEFGLAMIDFIRNIRQNIPELTQLAEMLGKLAASGVQKLGAALDKSIPSIKTGLDYLINNGDKVVKIIGTMAAAFVGMKFAPAAEVILRGTSGALFGAGGGKKSGGLLGKLFRGGQNTAADIGTIFNIGMDAAANFPADGSSWWRRASTGTAASFAALRNIGGLNSGKAGVRDAAWSKISTAAQKTANVGLWAAMKDKAANSATGKYVGGLGSSMGNLWNAVVNTKATNSLDIIKMGKPKAMGLNFLGNIANVGKAVGGVVSASGFGSLLSGALPIVGVISTIIAVVSLLGDNLESIRGTVEGVFGAPGLAIFDSFIGVLQRAGEFINSLFVDGGVAAAMAPLRETIVNLFGEDAGAAFDGLTTILQSVMGVVGQIVTFSNTTVKPIIESLFTFLTQTVIPIVLQTFTAAAPVIASILSGLGTAIMTVATIIGTAVRSILPTILEIVGGVLTAFNGLISFITGVFTGNWRQAWEGIKNIFGGIWDALVGLVKLPLNTVISLINGVIAGINSIGFTMPEWSPIAPGEYIGFNIPEFPLLGSGGFTRGPSIAGERGTEAVISFERSVRGANMRTWAEAGRMLGVKPRELTDFTDGGGSGGGGNFTFSPTIIIQGNADRSVVDEALAEAQAKFEAWFHQMQRKQMRTAY